MQLYRCNKAEDPRCPKCKEQDPHLIHADLATNQMCTQWSPCYDIDGNILFKVRCIKVK
jgi:hypothetical protein